MNDFADLLKRKGLPVPAHPGSCAKLDQGGLGGGEPLAQVEGTGVSREAAEGLSLPPGSWAVVAHSLASSPLPGEKDDE